MSTLPKVAVLGLGAMGHAFASNLLKNGFTVAGWNRSPARGEDLQAHGLSLHATPQQAVADAEVIISMLADGEATLEVLAQIAPACQPQAISLPDGHHWPAGDPAGNRVVAGTSASDDLYRCPGVGDQSPSGEGTDPGARQRR